MRAKEMLQIRYLSPIVVVASIRCTDHNARGAVVIAQIGTEIGLARCSDPASTDNAVTEMRMLIVGIDSG